MPWATRAGTIPARNVVIEMTPLPLAKRAKLYRDGAEVMTTTARRIAPSMLSPRAKTHNYLNMIMAEKPIKALNPDAWALLLDENGNLAEGLGSNIFIVREGELFTPSERYVLPGVSRQMTMDMAKQLGIACTQGDIDMFDAANAEEMFLTSTSLCILPVRSFNGAPVADGKTPGPDHQEADRRLFQGRRLRFRRPVPQVPAVANVSLRRALRGGDFPLCRA